MTARRAYGEDGLFYSEAKQRWLGVVSLGYTPDGKRARRTVTGQTKTEVKDKLKSLHKELDEGLVQDATYTVKQSVEAWLADCLAGKADSTVVNYRNGGRHIIDGLGAVKLKKLSAGDIHKFLRSKAPDLSTRTLKIILHVLRHSIRYAQIRELITRNVAELIDAVPTGRAGRPSKSMTLEQVVALLDAAKASRLYAYIVLSVMVGVRTEEARELRWDHVQLSSPSHVAVWRSVRAGGDTKTEKSRRSLGLPQLVTDALKELQIQQARDRVKAGSMWHETGLVFTTSIGTAFDAHNVRRIFRRATKAAGLGEDWVPRELRHSFVSLLSESGMAVEEISHLVGHNTTKTTETVYRHELRPVIQSGAATMDKLFTAQR
jgi:integrase